ncbi:ERF family protein [uncultured Vagococcus sp.]|uniref:ERF family protein n=1 Tax=uncultured Vagococcus sp. TaxID=189676 RepID=UPI0025898A97|nr:ERF family protein [uncultured Vagococcus sp.]
MKTSEQTNEIFTELVKFRKKVIQPKKDADNPFFKSKYVMLEGVVLSIDNAISDGDLKISYLQEVTSEGNQVSVTTHIIHESGQFVTFEHLNLPVSKNDAQAFGSAITYGKRYSLAAAFGITSDVDDDGNDAKKGAPSLANSTNLSVLKTKIAEFSIQAEIQEQATWKSLQKKLNIYNDMNKLTIDECALMLKEIDVQIKEFAKK